MVTKGGRDFCSPPSVTALGGGGWRSMSRPAGCIPPVGIPTGPTLTLAAGLGWTAVCRRLWSPRAPMVVRSPVFRMRPRRSPLVCANSGAYRNCCPAKRKDRSTIAESVRDWPVTTTASLVSVARAISDAGWAEFARLLRYKVEWRRGRVETADRWYPSSQVCSQCGARCHGLTLADRIFTCPCGYSADRDLNAAVNLAQWGENSAHLEPGPPSRVAGQTMPADGTALADTLRVPVKPARMTREPTFMLQLRSLN
jgi:hypothetical protein